MKKVFFFLFIFIFLSGCFPTPAEVIPTDDDKYSEYLAKQGAQDWEIEKSVQQDEEWLEHKYDYYEATDGRIDTLIEDEPLVEEDPGSGCPEGCDYHKSECDIKGNISIETGEKIYYVPSGEFYSKTKIDPEYGERWFCTEKEARANGWRKSKR